MKTMIFSVVILLLSCSFSFADDTMSPVFDKINDLVTRVESGISLNSYAESLAELKIVLKKSTNSDVPTNNPLFAERMNSVMTILDDYAFVWRGQENESFRYVSQDNYIFSSYPEVKACAQSQSFTIVYPISCVKQRVLERLYDNLDKAKSAHYNGW